MKKIVKLEMLKSILKVKKFRNIVFMSGAFDIFHHGHIVALGRASQLGSTFIVQIDGDSLVKKRKGKNRPYIDAIFRAQIIASFEFVDFVFISNFPSENARILKSINPDIYIRAIQENETNEIRKQREKMITAKLAKGKVFWLEQSNEISTTKLISLLKLKKHMFSSNQFIYE